MERYIAVDNVCAWPNLTRMPDGAVVATIFNQPTHGRCEGDVECWASTDGGRLWRRRGTPALHEPATNRMNVAAGLAGNGDLVVLASGWSNRPPTPEDGAWFGNAEVLPAWVCRSADGGRTWSIDKAAMPERPSPGMTRFIPFGDVLVGGDGALYATAYAGDGQGKDTNYFLRSADDGRTWTLRATIGADDFNETALLHLGGGRWLAAARTAKLQHLHLFRSDDEGITWRPDQILSLPRQIPAHLLRLADGRLLLTYGMRCPAHFGVAARISADDGETWSIPLMLVQYPDADGGYPASVQTADGRVVTAFYSASQPVHNRYHMGVVIWELAENNKAR